MNRCDLHNIVKYQDKAMVLFTLRKNDADFDYRQRYSDRPALGFKKQDVALGIAAASFLVRGGNTPY